MGVLLRGWLAALPVETLAAGATSAAHCGEDQQRVFDLAKLGALVDVTFHGFGSARRHVFKL